MDFSEYQELVGQTDEKQRMHISAYGLVDETGSVINVLKKRLLAGEKYPGYLESLREELGDLMWYIASVANISGLQLQDIAERNAEKARSPYDTGVDEDFDEGFPEDQRFPRQMTVTFKPITAEGRDTVEIEVNGRSFGNRLDDNSYSDDGYRFHDALHFGYVGVLGWSPVVRALLNRKRRSDKDIDGIEDGARAIFTEDAMTAFVFSFAQQRNLFENESTLDLGTLNTVKNLTDDLEVRCCTVKQWRAAIVLGYKVFRELREKNGGIMNIDLDGRIVEYARPLE